jgi:hypothetical protein
MTQAPLDLLGEAQDFTGLLAIVLAGPDATTAIDGMHQVVLEISSRLDLIKEGLECA